MTREYSRVIGALILTVAVSGCAGFEHSETLLSPSLPSAPGGSGRPGGSGGSGSGESGALAGTWTSAAPLTIPTSWGCGNFQWSIPDQSPSALAGDFYAICAGVVLVQGRASGQLNAAGTEVALHVTGTATVQGVIGCPFDLTGTGFIEGRDAIRIPYSGTTCLGPLHGEETLRRPSPAANEPPPPPPAPPVIEPPAPPAPWTNPNHVAPGPLTYDQAERVVYAAGREFPNLTAAPPNESEGISRAEELLLRTIWHLKLAGFDAGRQRNPSGAISNDKLTILINGRWLAFDIFYDVAHPGVPMTVIFLEVFPAGPLAYPGIPD